MVVGERGSRTGSLLGQRSHGPCPLHGQFGSVCPVFYPCLMYISCKAECHYAVRVRMVVVLVRETTLTVVRGLGRAFLRLSIADT